MRMRSIVAHDKTVTQPVVWITTCIIAAFHIGAFAALFFFSWKAFMVAVVLWWVAGGFGIGMGYHRLLTHRGYKTPKWMHRDFETLQIAEVYITDHTVAAFSRHRKPLNK
jgi:fatty-acid desaturase